MPSTEEFHLKINGKEIKCTKIEFSVNHQTEKNPARKTPWDKYIFKSIYTVNVEGAEL